MTGRTGILDNSPLKYVVASIRFASWPMLAKKIDEIHDGLRENLPIINRIQMRQIDPNNGQVVQEDGGKAWMLMPTDRSYGVQFAPEQLLILCKKYTRFDNLSDKLNLVLDKLIEHMRFVDVINMGVRYVDYIKIDPKEQLTDYISAGLLQPNITGLEKSGGAFFCSYKSNNTELRIRCIHHSESPSVPEDLIPLLAMTQDPQTPLAISQLKDCELLLDIDSIKNNAVPERMKKEEILSHLDQLHREANAFFRHESVCTDHAFKIWKGGN